MTTYTTWIVDDVLNICASVEEFCGQTSGSIYLDEINATKSPDPCTIGYNTERSCYGLHINNIQVTFKLAKTLGQECSHGTPTIVYRTIGTATTDVNGVCGLQCQITNQDRIDYENSGGNYQLFATISNAGGQPTLTTNICADSITILQNPCVGVTCPSNDCTGFDLYTYSCNPTTGICDRTLLTPLSPTCGYVVPSAETHYLYFQVPELYPVGYVISGISTIFQAASNAISGYTDYYVEAVDFDQVTYVITITITKTSILGIRGPNSGIQTMPIFLIIPIAYWLAVLAGIIAGTLYFLILRYLGSKSVTGEPVSTRVITVIPQICTGDATAGTTSCVNPTYPMVITVEYSLGKVNTIREITDGNPITFSSPTDVGITIIGKVKDNPYYTVIKKAIEKGITNETVTLKFMAKDDATITPSAADATTNNPINGSYIIYEETVDGSLVEVQRGNLDSSGKVVPPFKAKAGVNTCTIIIPADLDIHKTQMICIKPSAGDILNPIIPIKTCLEAKNHVSVRTVYISSADGGRYGYTADSIQIKVGTDIVNTVLPTTDITYIDGLTKNTNYIVHATKPGYTMINNDQPISFTTDCDTTFALLVESNPPSGTRDITIGVRNVTTAAIQGANVTLDSMPIRKTDETGTIAFMAIPDGDHDILLTLEGYKDDQSTITVSSTATSFTKTMIVDQVNATVDTRIDGFTNVGDAIATKPIKFEGYLQYLDTEAQPASYKPLTDATVTITVKDANNEILKTFTAVTGAGLLSVGYFETGEWLIINEFENTGITVEASFAGIGRYKPSSFSIDYAIAAADACVIPLPWGGCLLSKETGTSLLLLGALAVGGIVLMSSAAKSVTGGGATRIIERIPAHYTPPEIKRENVPK